MTTILVVDDEPIVREIAVRYLERAGYTTREAADGRAARRVLEQEPPDLVVLDVMLPGVDGLEPCRWIRARSELPVIMLTARGEEADRIVGLELGADDYITKPFSSRAGGPRPHSAAPHSADGSHRRSPVLRGRGARLGHARCSEGEEDVRLTAKEFDLLWFLASHPRRVFGRDQLMSRVWGYAAALDTGTITVHVRRLREKIEDDPATGAPADGVGRGLPAPSMILTAVVIAAATLSVGLLLAVSSAPSPPCACRSPGWRRSPFAYRSQRSSSRAG